MPPTRMFRDRMVSMEQTLEGGEKNLELLKTICREAFPDFEYREHLLDHERDLFLMRFEAADGRRKTVGWTRMVLFDAERLPALVENSDSPLKSRLLAFLQARALRNEIVVTFRHLEEGWVDTPEPRREKRRGRRGGRDGRGRGQGAGRERQGQGQGQPTAGAGAGAQGGGREGGRPPRGAQGRDRAPASVQGKPVAGGPGAPGGEPASAGGGERPGGRRRRFRRRRRGRGGSGAGGPQPTSGGGSGPGAGGARPS